MTCREVADFLADYLDGQLPVDVVHAFERHLEECPNCCAYLATYRATIELGRQAFARLEADAQTEIPQELVSAILNAVRR